MLGEQRVPCSCGGMDEECEDCGGCGDVLAGLRNALEAAQSAIRHGDRVDKRWWDAVHAESPEAVARIMAEDPAIVALVARLRSQRVEAP